MPRLFGIQTAAALLLIVQTARAGSAELPPPPPSAVRNSPAPPPVRYPFHEQIDTLIESARPDFSELDAGPADDAEFVRRAYLDLAGCVPDAEATREFLADDRPTSIKREELIDRLLASPQHVRRMQYVLDEMLIERRAGGNVPAAQWQVWLRDSVRSNKPWDELVHEILAADGADEQHRPPARFYLDRDFDINLVTRDVGRVFLGVDLECAQCHDHPIIADYEQRDYYGLTAFLQRSYLFTDPKSKQKMLGEKAEGDTTFTSVFTDEEGGTDPRLLDLPEIPDPEGMAEAYVVAPEKNVRAVPEYSRREQLARAMTADENVAFRRNIVNRLWALLMGRGLVEPLDMHHADNPPSHPELLQFLADEFLRNDYDVRHFLKELALTRTYQRSSRSPAERAEEAADTYAVGLLKPHSPEQLAWSLMEVTGVTDRTLDSKIAAALKEDPENGPALTADPVWREQTLADALKSPLDQFATRFAHQGGQQTGFESNAEQALFLINGPLVQGWLTPQAGNLTGRLMKFENPHEFADELYITVLSRPPTEEESREIADYLATVDSPAAAAPEIVWALLSSAEFRFNH